MSWLFGRATDPAPTAGVAAVAAIAVAATPPALSKNTTTGPACAVYRFEPGVDYVGGDVGRESVMADDVEGCCAACERTRLCNAFTFVADSQACWLKTSRRRARPAPDPTSLTSGFRGRLKTLSYGQDTAGSARLLHEAMPWRRRGGGIAEAPRARAFGAYGRAGMGGGYTDRPERRMQEQQALQLIARSMARWQGAARGMEGLPLFRLSAEPLPAALLNASLSRAHSSRAWAAACAAPAWMHLWPLGHMQSVGPSPFASAAAASTARTAPTGVAALLLPYRSTAPPGALVPDTAMPDTAPPAWSRLAVRWPPSSRASARGSAGAEASVSGGGDDTVEGGEARLGRPAADPDAQEADESSRMAAADANAAAGAAAGGVAGSNAAVAGASVGLGAAGAATVPARLLNGSRVLALSALTAADGSAHWQHFRPVALPSAEAAAATSAASPITAPAMSLAVHVLLVGRLPGAPVLHHALQAEAQRPHAGAQHGGRPLSSAATSPSTSAPATSPGPPWLLSTSAPCADPPPRPPPEGAPSTDAVPSDEALCLRSLAPLLRSLALLPATGTAELTSARRCGHDWMQRWWPADPALAPATADPFPSASSASSASSATSAECPSGSAAPPLLAFGAGHVAFIALNAALSLAAHAAEHAAARRAATTARRAGAAWVVAYGEASIDEAALAGGRGAQDGAGDSRARDGAYADRAGARARALAALDGLIDVYVHSAVAPAGEVREAEGGGSAGEREAARAAQRGSDRIGPAHRVVAHGHTALLGLADDGYGRLHANRTSLQLERVRAFDGHVLESLTIALARAEN